MSKEIATTKQVAVKPIADSDAKKIVIKPVKTAEFPDGLEFAGTTLGVR